MTINTTATGKTASFVTITYLTGAIRDEALGIRRPDFGVLLTPLMGNHPQRIGTHAHDNGVWSEFKSKGKKPFSLPKFLAHLDKWHAEQDRCLFAAAPDVVGDWRATLERSRPVFPEIRKRGYRAALVAQDGLEHHMDEIPWDEFDVLFLGGGQDPKYLSKTNRVRVKNPTTGRRRWVGEWKLTQGAARLTAEARRRGKDVHMGRVNSRKRLAYAQAIGCTSADGTIIAYSPDVRTPEVEGWIQDSNQGARLQLSSCFICRSKIHALCVAYHLNEQAYLERLQRDGDSASCSHWQNTRREPGQLPEPIAFPSIRPQLAAAA